MGVFLHKKIQTFSFLTLCLTSFLFYGQQTPFNGPHVVPGTIESEDFDNGGQDISYRDNEIGTNPNATVSDYRKVNGITDPDVEVLSGGGFSNGQKVGWMNGGDWLEYTFEATQVENDDYIIKVRATSTTAAAAGGDNKGYRLLLDGVDVSGNVKVNPAGGFFSQFLEIETETKITQGQHILRVEVFTTVGTTAIDLDSMQFISKAASLQEPLSVSELINNNCVLQRNTDANIWGKGEPGNQVTINPQWGSILTTTVGIDGKWSIKVPTPDTGGNGPFTLEISDATKSFTFNNIMLGEVWLCSGQSNMGITLNVSGFANVINSEAEISNSNFPNLRLLKVGISASYEPQEELNIAAGWTVSSPSTSGAFSAVAYFFGRDLLNGLGGSVPVGLIVAARGSTSAQPFTTAESLQTIPGFENVLTDLAAAKVQHEAGVTSGTPFTGTYNIHNATVNPPPGFETPGAIYNSMIAPMTPFTLKGAIFYQGESNVPDEGEFYNNVFRALINSWRTAFDMPQMPFYYVQIAPLNGYNFRPGGVVEKSWEIREAQFLAKDIPNTGVAVILDSGEIDDIHPETKQVPGNRLALLALNKTYGQNIVSSGPIFKSAEFTGNKGVLSFDSIGTGLELQNGVPEDDNSFGSLFEIAGADNQFKKATVTIVGDDLEISSLEVPNPTQARYAWKNWINQPTLFNKEGLPSSSFRTMLPSYVLSITDNSLSKDSFSYNNPISNTLKIESSLKIESIKFYNQDGAIVTSAKGSSINTSNLAVGVYIVLITTDTGQNTVVKVVKR